MRSDPIQRLRDSNPTPSTLHAPSFERLRDRIIQDPDPADSKPRPQRRTRAVMSVPVLLSVLLVAVLVVGALVTLSHRHPASGPQAKVAGSPPTLASLHRQAGQLLGGSQALAARLHSLRGYPVVINAWASWCGPCRSEFSLFASASARYGHRVAFLGADTNDSPGDARTFLNQHPVSYPSYQTTTTDLGPLAAIEGLPTTIFLSPAGKVTYVHVGQYDTEGTLDQDISTYAHPSSTP